MLVGCRLAVCTTSACPSGLRDRCVSCELRPKVKLKQSAISRSRSPALRLFLRLATYNLKVRSPINNQPIAALLLASARSPLAVVASHRSA
eukprot:scaffold2672_cov112-Isochrysis_galbana.AAC.2